MLITKIKQFKRTEVKVKKISLELKKEEKYT